MERAKSVLLKDKAPPCAKKAALDDGADGVSIGVVMTPDTFSRRSSEKFQKAWSANSGLFHFSANPSPQKYR